MKGKKKKILKKPLWECGTFGAFHEEKRNKIDGERAKEAAKVNKTVEGGHSDKFKFFS